jgi:hypothetical protein
MRASVRLWISEEQPLLAGTLGLRPLAVKVVGRDVGELALEPVRLEQRLPVGLVHVEGATTHLRGLLGAELTGLALEAERMSLRGRPCC